MLRILRVINELTIRGVPLCTVSMYCLPAKTAESPDSFVVPEGLVDGSVVASYVFLGAPAALTSCSYNNINGYQPGWLRLNPHSRLTNHLTNNSSANDLSQPMTQQLITYPMVHP